MLIGDPDCDVLRTRGQEERFGHGIESRCRLARPHYQALPQTAGIPVAQHPTTLYGTGYRADDDMYVDTHLNGVNAYGKPVLLLRRHDDGGPFDAYAAGSDAVGRTSRYLKE
ncbi:hypothetical protein [Nocardiopsis lucentensis]|uniref:hypothetical protein n=1 Tax=Nocardiopsis lucentensis TaxID=53441 RepID=UPI00037768BC|nr:hypothetical protein [Nocardiopsis lucentensis]